MYANGNSFCFNGNSTYGNSAACVGAGGGGISLPSLYVRVLTVVQMPREM